MFVLATNMLKHRCIQLTGYPQLPQDRQLALVRARQLSSSMSLMRTAGTVS